jgi:hypothetical protein
VQAVEDVDIQTDKATTNQDGRSELSTAQADKRRPRPSVRMNEAPID